jgi:hypothetical protein
MEVTMRKPHVNDYVRLTQDIPELLLHCGEIGVVRSTWFAPAMAYEVEFHPVGLSHETRALLQAEQVRVEDGPLLENVEGIADDVEIVILQEDPLHH